MGAVPLRRLIAACEGTIAAHAGELTALDQAIGDGDHGLNMQRGFKAMGEAAAEIAGLPFGPALQKAGMTLVMKVGGASGPLYGSLLMAMGKAGEAAPGDRAGLAQVVAAGVDAVKARGKSDVGAKTMLDVLAPVQAALAEGADVAAVRAAADAGLAATQAMRATKGRAAFLGERSIGHLDPGARSSALLVHAVCDVLEEVRRSGGRMTDTVSIVIVSHSADVAKGAADMVRQMVGEEVRVAFCGGNGDGGLGTDVAAILAAIESVYTAKGVAVLVDLGGAETNSEMAIEMLPEGRGGNVRICNAPIVEGAVMAATEAAGGAALAVVCATAEEFQS